MSARSAVALFEGEGRGRPVSARRLYRTRSTSRAGQLELWNGATVSLIAALLLSLVGVYCINLTAGVGAEGLGYYAKKQLVFTGLGLLAACIVAVPHYRNILILSPALVALSFAMLIFVLLPFVPEWIVTPRNGARRWISLVVTDFQPSELAKIAYVLAMASHLRYRRHHRRLLGLLPPALITLIPMGLILLEPDLGTAALFVPTLAAMLVAAGARMKHLILIAIVLLAVAPAMYPVLRPHQKQRIHALINQIKGDTSEADTINYQGFKAMTLTGAGGVTGMDEARSRAVVDFNELPEDHNDMIFAVIVNRFGLLGGFGVMGLYLLWTGGALRAAVTCRDAFGRLLIVGLASFVASQAVINMAITVGLLPITGMTLPFVSYGGSSLVSVFILTGLIFNVAMRRSTSLNRHSFEFDGDDGG